MELVNIKLLGRSLSSTTGDSLPGARPASSTTRRPCSGGQAGIMCSTMYSADSNVTDWGILGGASLGEALSLGLAIDSRGQQKSAPTSVEAHSLVLRRTRAYFKGL